MSALMGILLGSILIFGPIFAVCKYAEKYRPNATVGEVGPLIICIIMLELFVLLAFLAGG